MAALEDKYEAREKVIANIRGMFKQNTDGSVSARLTVIKRRYKTQCTNVVDLLTTNRDQLTTYTINHHIPGANVMAKDINRQLQTRLKSIEAF